MNKNIFCLLKAIDEKLAALDCSGTTSGPAGTSNTVVPTGADVNGCPVHATVTSDDTPEILSIFYINEVGELVNMSSGQTFTKTSALKPSIQWACLWLNDLANSTAREVMQRVMTTCDAAGNVIATAVDLFELDRTTPITPLGTEVLSKSEACFSLGQESVVVADPFAGLTIPAGAEGANVQVDPDGNAIRYTFDGSVPNDDSFAASPGSWITICKAADLAGFQAISADAEGAVDGALGAQLQVSYVSTELH